LAQVISLMRLTRISPVGRCWAIVTGVPDG